MIFHDPLS